MWQGHRHQARPPAEIHTFHFGNCPSGGRYCSWRGDSGRVAWSVGLSVHTCAPAKAARRKRSLKISGLSKVQLPVASCQKRSAQFYYLVNIAARGISITGRISSRKFFEWNILTSNSFRWNILRGKVFIAPLFPIFCGGQEGGGVTN